MKKSHLLAIIAFAMVLGLGVPALLAANTSLASAEAEDEQANNLENNLDEDVPSGAITPTETEQTDSETPSADTVTSTEGAGNLAELKTALEQSADTILITAPIDLTESLNLGGKTLQLASGVTRMFTISEGDITIENGILKSNTDANQTGDAILWVMGSIESKPNSTTLTVAENVKIETINSYGLAVHYLKENNPDFSSHGVTVNFAGTIEAPYGISVNGNIQDLENAPIMNINGTITSTADDLAIFAAGYAEWNISSATLTGATPLGIKSGKFTLDNSTLAATSEFKNLEATGSGMTPNGATIQLENSQAYAGAIDITVKSGAYTSTRGPVFSEYGSIQARTAGSHLENLSISGGTFTSGGDQPIFDKVSPAETVITGGEFSSIDGLEDYLKTDQKLVLGASGKYVIQTTNTPTDPETSDDDKPAVTPGANQKPDSSSPNTGVLATIENAANAIGAVGTTIITGVLVASGAALAWFIGSRRRAAESSSKSKKSSKSNAKSAKSGRGFHLDRIEVEISTTPRQAAKATRSPAKTSRTVAKTARSASKVVSASAKSSSKVAKPTAKTAKKLPTKSAKASAKASRTAKSASSRKTAPTPSKSAKASKTTRKSR